MSISTIMSWNDPPPFVSFPNLFRNDSKVNHAPITGKMLLLSSDLGTYVLTTWRVKKYSQAQLVNFLSLSVRNLNPKALCSLSLRSPGRQVCHIRDTLPRTFPHWHQTIRDWCCFKRSEIIFNYFHLRLGSLAKFSDFFSLDIYP